MSHTMKEALEDAWACWGRVGAVEYLTIEIGWFEYRFKLTKNGPVLISQQRMERD